MNMLIRACQAKEAELCGKLFVDCIFSFVFIITWKA